MKLITSMNHGRFGYTLTWWENFKSLLKLLRASEWRMTSGGGEKKTPLPTTTFSDA